MSMSLDDVIHDRIIAALLDIKKELGEEAAREARLAIKCVEAEDCSAVFTIFNQNDKDKTLKQFTVNQADLVMPPSLCESDEK